MPGAAGRWTLISRTRGDAPEVSSAYDDAGTLLRRTWPDGRVSERIELGELHRLWERKGLTGPGAKGPRRR